MSGFYAPFNKTICTKCGAKIAILAKCTISSCYQCSKCHARYIKEKAWEMYDQKKFEWIKV